MTEYFVEGKWYQLNGQRSFEFINEAKGVNSKIASYLGDRAFEVKYDTSCGDVMKIRFAGGDWVERTEAIPECPGSEYGYCWFYEEDSTEYEYFDEVEEPVQGKCCIVVLTADDTNGDSYWNGTRTAIGGANPTMLTMDEAKERVQNFLTNTEDPRATAEIFVLKTTAKLVKEIKFS